MSDARVKRGDKFPAATLARSFETNPYMRGTYPKEQDRRTSTPRGLAGIDASLYQVEDICNAIVV